MGAFPFKSLKRFVVWTIIGTGITSVTAQLLTLREFLSQFQGNEITISLVLFCWLLLSGLGSLLEKGITRPKLPVYATLLLVIAVWPLFQLLLIRWARALFFIHGASAGFYTIFFTILATTAPYCLLIGFILPHAQKVLHAHGHAFSSGDLYLTDGIGDAAGGALFSFALVYWFKPFATVALSSAPLLVAVFYLLLHTKRYAFLAAGTAVSAVFLGAALNSELELRSLSAQYGRVVRYAESPYGRVVVSGERDQFTVWESGAPVYSGENIIEREEKIHIPLSQLDRIESVLLVSGGLGETPAEIAKYGPSRVDYVELDPRLVRAARAVGLVEDDAGVHIMATDARHFIRNSKMKYDAVIVDLPDPDNFQLNRFFTREFIELARQRLRQGGVLSLSMAYSPNYISKIRREKLSILYNTLSAAFSSVMAVPAEAVYFVCRDGPLTFDIPERLRASGISTSYIEGFYSGDVTADRKRQLREALAASSDLNTDFEPGLMRAVFREWFDIHGRSPAVFVIVTAFLLGVYLFFMKRSEYVLFSTGLAAMGVELALVFAFQVIYGYIYLKIGAVITVFLLGLLPGALLGRRWAGYGKGVLLGSESLMLALLGLFYLWTVMGAGPPGPLSFLGYGFLFACLCGLQFPVAAHLIGESKSPAAGCLAADLCGAAVGTLVIGAVLIPFFGVRQALIFLLLVKTSSLLMVIFYGRAGKAA